MAGRERGRLGRARLLLPLPVGEFGGGFPGPEQSLGDEGREVESLVLSRMVWPSGLSLESEDC
jgi:hypothetical protein